MADANFGTVRAITFDMYGTLLDLETSFVHGFSQFLKSKGSSRDAAEVMQTNASYVFFRELEKDGPVGSQGVVLTPNRSLAVDRRFLPLGAPIWIDTTAPSAQTETPDRVLRRLFVAQDTGGAIRGPVRADIFWGAGRDAAEIAGKMRHEGRMWILLPTGTVDPGGSPS